jgi:phenylpyruvate C(3)-methyltransferase
MTTGVAHITVSDSRSQWPADWTGGTSTPISADQAFNGYVAAMIVFSLDRMGLLDGLLERGQVDIAGFCAASGADEQLIREVLSSAEACGYVRVRDGTVSLTRPGREMARMRGYFTWCVGGYGDVFSGIADITTGQRAFGRDVFRNEAMVALGSRQCDHALMADTLDAAMADVDFSLIADLGSGTAARVCRVVAGRDDAGGVGLDISDPATQLAEATIRDAGLAGRVHAVKADILNVIRTGSAAGPIRQVDTVMSFFLLHDLLASPETRSRILPQLREAFPRARTFVLADTMLRPTDGFESSLPIFSVGYQLAHALMRIPLHTKETYERLFGEAGLHIRRVLPFGTPHSWLYVLDVD